MSCVRSSEKVNKLLLNYSSWYAPILRKRYITIETKEAGRVGYNGFLFPLSMNVKKETRYIQYGHPRLFQQ